MVQKIEEGEKGVDVFKNDMAKLTVVLMELQSKLQVVGQQVQGTS